MLSLLRRFALIALVPAALTGAAMIASPAEAAPVSEATLQADINRLTNVQRKAHGCAALTVNVALTKAARGHSTYMAKSGTFSHTGLGGTSFVARVKTAGYSKPAAENIAWGYRTGADVVKGWMNSPGHRANIVNCKNKTVGVGAVYAKSGAPYFTQDFGY
ncbi:CAP domain-containing protein [Actinoplanes sp. GCM10030250]|uniref:CAP domain-containing protein n=1 Tax=Actinoplanes sp. GCM10030250 TaxID=3273376 RepID=UPI003609F6ED